MTAEEVLDEVRADLDTILGRIERLREDFDGLIVAIAEGEK